MPMGATAPQPRPTGVTDTAKQEAVEQILLCHGETETATGSPLDRKTATENKFKAFEYYCATYHHIEDKETHATHLFTWYDCQYEVAWHLICGHWLWILKARQLGMTTLLGAYATWLTTFYNSRVISVMNQEKEYAEDFLDRVRFAQDRLPKWMRPVRTVDNVTKIEMNRAGHGCAVRSFASTANAARSTSGDLVIFDEAAFHRFLKKSMRAAEPTVEASGGQIVGLSTSAGPQGQFYKTWEACQGGKSKYTPIFYDWRARPGRTDEWYKTEKELPEHEADPLYMKREYPESPEEAFESAEGRVYPLFVRKDNFIREIKPYPDWKKYRGIDFGGRDPFVCLWGTVIPGDGAGFTIDPGCTNTIRELLAYSRAENGYPADVDNHACDALRYMVITPGIDGVNGHLHIYREYYIPNSASRGLSLPDLAAHIKERSVGERYDLTVADRSRPDLIVQLGQLMIPSVGQRALRGEKYGEIEQGIVRLNILIVGTSKGKEALGLPIRNRIKGSFAPKGVF